jgi:uncharacterized protein YydD (DUF2326 family)
MIKKLYSNSGLLLDVYHFHNGLNFILGKYSNSKKSTGINGIGKSTLIRLINFCLLSDTSESLFNKSQYSFLRIEKHDISLTIEINNLEYIITRYFNNLDLVIISKDFIDAEYTKNEARDFLFNIFFPFDNSKTIIHGNRLGTLLSFFIKDDLQYIQRIDPTNFLSYSTNAREKAIYNFYLLNLPNINIYDFDKEQIAKEKAQTAINEFTAKLTENTNKSLEEFKTEKNKIESSIKILEESINTFTFNNVYEKYENDLLDITNKINEKLKLYHINRNSLKKISSSIKQIEELDLIKVKKIYNEARDKLGDYIHKNIEEIISFRKEIVLNRNKYLSIKASKIKDTIDKLQNEISILENTRSELYKKLDENGAIDSIKNSFQQIVIEKTDLQKNLGLLSQIDDFNDQIININKNISEIKVEIVNFLREAETRINDLRILFNEILENAIFHNEDYSDSYFDIKITPTSRINALPFKISVEIPKADALGQSRLKLIAYDLTIFLNNIKLKRKIPNFLVHDGAFHGISIETKINILNYLYQFSLKYSGMQYIATFNEDEIISDIKMSKRMNFNFRELLVAEFSDIDSKTIFKRIFN